MTDARLAKIQADLTDRIQWTEAHFKDVTPIKRRQRLAGESAQIAITYALKKAYQCGIQRTAELIEEARESGKPIEFDVEVRDLWAERYGDAS